MTSVKALAGIFAILVFLGASSQRGYRKVGLDHGVIESVAVSANGTVISFPTSPERVVVGSKDQFSIEIVGRDLAIAPLRTTGTSNIFVYLLGRRFNFRLHTSLSVGDLVVEVFDQSSGVKYGE